MWTVGLVIVVEGLGQALGSVGMTATLVGMFGEAFMLSQQSGVARKNHQTHECGHGNESPKSNVACIHPCMQIHPFIISLGNVVSRFVLRDSFMWESVDFHIYAEN